jgi:hypothetical protein
MTVEGIIAETLDLVAMRQQWTQDTPRLRQGMRVLAYQPLSVAYHNLHTLDRAYYGSPEPDELAESPARVTGTPPPEEPASSEPASVSEDSAADDDAMQRKLDLSGTGQEGGFNLLASPFSTGDVEKDEM